jgi:hypothetical protein
MAQDARLKGIRSLGYLVVNPALPAPEGPLYGSSKVASVIEQAVYPSLCLAAELLSLVK